MRQWFSRNWMLNTGLSRLSKTAVTFLCRIEIRVGYLQNTVRTSASYVNPTNYYVNLI
jgi:hypothetical protein